jgi:hypothetical protein
MFANENAVANRKLLDFSWRLHPSLALLHGVEPELLCDCVPMRDDIGHCQYVINH